MRKDEKLQRNLEIAKKKQEGATYRELMEQYPLSFARLQQIVKKYANA